MKVYGELPKNLWDWALQQPLFFVGSAPLAGKHINVSPKGLPGATFTVFDSTHCAYVDHTGSGSETIAHCYENGRATIMFCSFDTLPRIMRWYCEGSVIEHADPRFEPTLKKMGKEREPGQRAIIMLRIWKVTTSCGTGVPILGRPQSSEEEQENDDGASDGIEIPTQSREWLRDRASMRNWEQGMEDRGKMLKWQVDYNAESLDGVPAMRSMRKKKGQWVLLEDMRFAFVRSTNETGGLVLGLVLGALLMLAMRVFGYDLPR